jgi:uncharacterized LabA/DUF88 family protein
LTEDSLKIAVFIDFDNIEIGVKTTLGVHFDIGAILEAIKERGEVVTKIAYGDWKRAGDHSRLLTQHAIRMVQRNVTPGGDKNGADINLALDALEMALTHDHINAFVIVGGDSDFISLVEKLKQYDRKVFVVGGRAFTSVILQKNCHEFIAYENLVTPPRAARRAAATPEKDRTAPLPLNNAVPLVERALQVLADREVSPQLGLLKSTLLQLDSAFSERNYGTGSFREFAEKLAQAGYVNLRQSGRSVLVELPEGQTAPQETEMEVAAFSEPASAELPSQPAEPETPPVAQPVAPPPAGLPADAIQAVRRMFEAGLNRVRWPMYVRNVKQFLRGVDGGFDERRYGFGGLVDLLRGCQREGLFRLERDRQGVLRVFPGPLLQRPAEQPAAAIEPEPGPVTGVGEPEPVSAVVDAEIVAEAIEAEAPAGVRRDVVIREAAGAAPEPSQAAAEGVAVEQPEAAPMQKRARKRAATGTRKAAGTSRKRATTPRKRVKKTS